MLKPIQLQPEQLRVLKLDAKGAIQIKGVAGSGKTTVALYRAKYLIENFPSLFEDSTVVIFTYNRLLANYLERLKTRVSGGYNPNDDTISQNSKAGMDVEVINFHRWAYKFLCDHINMDEVRMITGYEQSTLISELLRTNKKLNFKDKSIEFLIDEISWIKGRNIRSEEEYISSPRIGRGSTDKMNEQMKCDMWQLITLYNSSLEDNHQMDFDDYAIKVLDILNSKPNFVPPFTHIVIDEAQDLNKAQLMVIKQLVSPNTNSITIIADTAQRIYKSGFTWREIGFEFKGRTRILKRNYRSTIEISRAAQSLLSNDMGDEDYTQIESARRGKYLPIVGCFDSSAKQWEYIISELKSLTNDFESIVLLHRNRSGVRSIAKRLEQNGFDSLELNTSEKHFQTSKIHVSTLSSIKGLEFEVVIIIDCNDDMIPAPYGFNGEDDDLHIATERRLLFTAMTRAREKLYILSGGTPSRYLKEINEDYIDLVKK